MPAAALVVQKRVFGALFVVEPADEYCSIAARRYLAADTFTHFSTVIDEYGRMRLLEGFTAQSRGQQFNGLTADMLRC